MTIRMPGVKISPNPEVEKEYTTVCDDRNENETILGDILTIADSVAHTIHIAEDLERRLSFLAGQDSIILPDRVDQFGVLPSLKDDVHYLYDLLYALRRRLGTLPDDDPH